MQYLTTTDLRTKSSKLVALLKRNSTITLIHRSKIVGVVKPAEITYKPLDVKKFKQLLKNSRPKKLIPRNQREEVYRKYLKQKYG